MTACLDLWLLSIRRKSLSLTLDGHAICDGSASHGSKLAATSEAKRKEAKQDLSACFQYARPVKPKASHIGGLVDVHISLGLELWRGRP